MARLARTRVEWESYVFERSSVVEEHEPPPYARGTTFRVIGKGQPRVDGPERVTGRAKYTCDVLLPGMLYARVLRCPLAHARIRRIDSTAAWKAPGVRGILSAADVTGVSGSPDLRLFDRTLHFAGDEVAAVAADDPALAEDALRLIHVECEQLPFVVDAEAALQPGAPVAQEGGNLAHGRPEVQGRGNMADGFGQADIIVEETFRTQSALHNCLETHGATAMWDGGNLTVWESTQAIFRVRDELAEAFQMPPTMVRVICEYMGGGFGSKQSTGKWALMAAALSRQTGRPVQLVLDRQSDSLSAGHRAPTVQHVKIGAKRDGTLTAIELQAVVNIGALASSGRAVYGPYLAMYACPNVRTEMRSVFTNTGPHRSFRGPGYTEGAFGLESAIDDLASRLEIDPLAIRIKNSVTSEPGTRRPYSARYLEECYRRGAQLIGWEHRTRDGSSHSRFRRGLGMAGQVWGGGGGPPAYAWVRLDQDGRVIVITGSQDIGTGTKTVFAQIAAEEFGIPAEEVTVHAGDTEIGPYAPVSWGSMTVSTVGPAVRQAAVDARTQICGIAAALLGVPEQSVQVSGGAIVVRGEPKPRMTLKEMGEEIGDMTILGKGARGVNDPAFEVRTFGAQFAEVEVDTLTGEVRLPRMVTVHDSGRIFNPIGASNQVQGAVVQGIGYALTESRIVDEATGVVLNANLEDYMVPSALDFERIDYDFVNIPDDRANILGAKGLGEPAMIPTAPAIANALANALNIRFLSIPITRDRILEAISPGGNNQRRSVP